MKKSLSKEGARVLRGAAFKLEAHNGKAFIGIIDFALRKASKLYINCKNSAEVNESERGIIPEPLQINIAFSFEFTASDIQSRKKIKGGYLFKIKDEQLTILTSGKSIRQIQKMLGIENTDLLNT